MDPREGSSGVGPHIAHREAGPRDLGFFVVTVSTSRYIAMASGQPFKDESGDLAESLIRARGYRVVGRRLIRDDVDMIKELLNELLARGDVDVVVFTGGTGLARGDVTIEAVRPFFEKEIEGFGEIFRYVSYSRIGPAAMLTRATAGVSRGKLIICLPGSPDAVRTGLDLILDEAPHVIYLARS